MEDLLPAFSPPTRSTSPTTASTSRPTIHDTVVETRLFDVNITVSGPLDISADVISDSEDVNITQNSLAAGNTSTISGNVTANTDVNLLNTGGSSTHLNVSGTLTAGDDVQIPNGGNMMLATVNAGDDIFVVALGSKVWFNGPQTAGDVWSYTVPTRRPSCCRAR